MSGNKKEWIKNWKIEKRNCGKSSDSRAFPSTKSLL